MIGSLLWLVSISGIPKYLHVNTVYKTVDWVVVMLQEIGTGGGSAWTQEPISEQNKALDRKRKRRKKVKIKTRASDSEEEEVVRLDTPDTAV